jgi:mono/diheme cytochrome c family protein
VAAAQIAALTATPVIEIDLDMELPEGDPQRSLSRAIQFQCAGCHTRAYGPSFGASAGLPSILERGELRIADPAYQGSASTNREYIIESVFLPEAYVVPGNWPQEMPTNYVDRLTEQDLADIFVWLGTFE